MGSLGIINSIPCTRGFSVGYVYDELYRRRRDRVFLVRNGTNRTDETDGLRESIEGRRLRAGDPLGDSPADPLEADWCPAESDTMQVGPGVRLWRIRL